MEGEWTNNRILVWFILIGLLVLGLVLSAFCYASAYNKSYCNVATERGDVIYLNDVKYVHADLQNYTISNVLICKTDTGLELYEIEEYPNYEYIGVYSAWDGKIYRMESVME